MHHSPADAITVIKGSLEASFNNQATFPEHVKTVASVGVTRYEIDLLNHQAKYYWQDDTSHTIALPAMAPPSDANSFSKPAVKAAIAEIQQGAIDYPTFLKRIIAAGIKGYEVNIDAGKVVYQGETENYTEAFPTPITA